MNIKTKFAETIASLKALPGISKVDSLPLPSYLKGKPFWLMSAALVLIFAGGFAYYELAFLPSTAAAEPGLQTATVRQGDLVIYASGTGTLIASDEVELAFKTGGQVAGLFVKVGNQVNAGDLLAEVDDSDIQIAYKQAKRSYLEQTSVNAVATAEQAIATAQEDLGSAVNHLMYLISPNVYNWEQEVVEAEGKVEAAREVAHVNPSDEEAQAALEKAETYLEYANASLESAWYSYKKEYVPRVFKVSSKDIWTKQVKNYIAAPTEADITEARAAVIAAEETLQEANWLYAALSGGDVPDDATGSGLIELEQALLDLNAAQADLDGTKLVAPISGTVMAVDTRLGDTVSSGTTLITVADLSQPLLEVYLDESDWSNVVVGHPAEVTFDIQPDAIYTGTVTQVDPGLYTENESSVVRALVQLDETQQAFNLPLGTAATVDVIGGQAQAAILVPIEALQETSPGKYAVYQLEDNEPKLRQVEVGIQDALYAEIKSGLEVGDIVVTGEVETE